MVCPSSRPIPSPSARRLWVLVALLGFLCFSAAVVVGGRVLTAVDTDANTDTDSQLGIDDGGTTTKIIETIQDEQIHPIDFQHDDNDDRHESSLSTHITSLRALIERTLPRTENLPPRNNNMKHEEQQQQQNTIHEAHTHTTSNTLRRRLQSSSSSSSSSIARRLFASSDESTQCPCIRHLSTRVLMICHGTVDTSPTWRAIRDGFFEAGKLVGVETEAIFLTSDQLVNQFGNSAIVGLNTILDQQYARFESELLFPAVLITSIPNAQLQQSRINKWFNAGVKILTYNGDSNDADLLHSIYHFSSDDDLGGSQAGFRFAQSGVTRAVCLIPETLGTNVIQRCSGFLRTFTNMCSSPDCWAAQILVPSLPNEDAIALLSAILKNSTIEGILAVGPSTVQRILPMLEQAEYRQVGRRVAVFDAIDERLYQLLDEQVLFFAVDVAPFLQGFMPVVFASYLIRTGQRLSPPTTSTGEIESNCTWMKTGPVFVAARGVSTRTRPSIDDIHLDVVTHSSDSDQIWSNFKSGVQLAASNLKIRFKDCSTLSGDTSCSITSAQKNVIRYYSPTIGLDVGSMANFLNRVGEQGSHGVVATLPSTAILTEPVRRLVTGGIPVLSANTGDETFTSMGTLGHVSLHSYESGRRAGIEAVKFGGVRAICLSSSRANAAFARRCAGFQQGMLEQLNATNSPWMPSDTSLYDTISVMIVADLNGGDVDGENDFIEALLERPEINFVLAAAGTLAPAIGEIARKLGRFNVSAVAHAFRSVTGGPVLQFGAANPPPYPYSATPVQPILIGGYDCTADLKVMMRNALLTFCVDQQEMMQGWLPTMLLGVRALTGLMINSASPVLYPTGPADFTMITMSNLDSIACVHRSQCQDEIEGVVTNVLSSSENGCPTPSYAGDGWCDEENNIDGCWDGGDCCSSTCRGGPTARSILDPNRYNYSTRVSFTCGTDTFGTGWNTYNCINPNTEENGWGNDVGASSSKTNLNSGGFIALYVTVGVLAVLFFIALVVGITKWKFERKARRIDRRNREVAEAQARAQSAFLAHMSHELRTPIHAVLGTSNLLALTALNEEQREYAIAIEKSSMHLLGVVNDILDFSRLESSPHLDLSCAMFSIRGLVEDSFDMACGTGHIVGMEMMMCIETHPAFYIRNDHGHDDDSDNYVHTQPKESGWPEPLFYGDQQRIRQILVNLLANALKFSRCPGEVEVDVSYAETIEDLFTRGLILPSTPSKTSSSSSSASSGAAAKQRKKKNKTNANTLTKKRLAIGLATSTGGVTAGTGVELASTTLAPHRSCHDDPHEYDGAHIELDGIDVSPPCIPIRHRSIDLNSYVSSHRHQHQQHSPKKSMTNNATGNTEASLDTPYILIGVRDTGMGLAHNVRSKLFQPFLQLDHSSTRKFQGTGLGLTIAQKIVRSMDGYLWLVSEQDRGSVFYFALPIRSKPIDAQASIFNPAGGTVTTGGGGGGGGSLDSSTATTANTTPYINETRTICTSNSNATRQTASLRPQVSPITVHTPPPPNTFLPPPPQPASIAIVMQNRHHGILLRYMLRSYFDDVYLAPSNELMLEELRQRHAAANTIRRGQSNPVNNANANTNTSATSEAPPPNLRLFTAIILDTSNPTTSDTSNSDGDASATSSSPQSPCLDLAMSIRTLESGIVGLQPTPLLFLAYSGGSEEQQRFIYSQLPSSHQQHHSSSTPRCIGTKTSTKSGITLGRIHSGRSGPESISLLANGDRDRHISRLKTSRSTSQSRLPIFHEMEEEIGGESTTIDIELDVLTQQQRDKRIGGHFPSPSDPAGASAPLLGAGSSVRVGGDDALPPASTATSATTPLGASGPALTSWLTNPQSIDVLTFTKQVGEYAESHSLRPYGIIHKPLRHSRLLQILFDLTKHTIQKQTHDAATTTTATTTPPFHAPTVPTHQRQPSNAETLHPAHTPAQATQTQNKVPVPNPLPVLPAASLVIAPSPPTGIVRVHSVNPVVASSSDISSSIGFTPNGSTSQAILIFGSPSGLASPPDKHATNETIGASIAATPSSAAAVAPSAAASSSSSSSTSAPTSLHILIAEDQVVNQKLMSRMLLKLGHTSEVAEDGLIAIEKVHQAHENGRQYDIILMDVQMPCMDGVDATRHLCDWFETETLSHHSRGLNFTHPLVLGLTAHAMISEQSRCLEAGMRCVLTKPLSITALDEALKRWAIIAQKERLEKQIQ